VGYMAPEQVRGLPTDHRADIFSLGAVLYEMLSGERAFKGDTAADVMSAILREEPPELSVDVRSASPVLARIVERCLAKNANARFKSADDLAFALDALSSGSRSGSVVVADARQGSSDARWRWMALAFALGALAMGAALSPLLGARRIVTADDPVVRLQL